MASEAGLAWAKRVWGWEAHSVGQREWMVCGAKVKAAACGRRWGKSESMAVDIILFALGHPNSIQAVLAPEHENTREITEKIELFLYAAKDIEGEFAVSRSPGWKCVFNDGTRLKRPTTIRARTLGATGQGVRGRNAHRVIVDEAAFVDDRIMRQVVTPLLADFDGDLILISSPAGRNHFYETWQRGQDPLQPRYESFQFPSWTNPHLPPEYIEAERATMPEREFRIEYGAEFADAEGRVFRNVLPCCEGDWAEPVTGRSYAAGLDLARVNDFTVLSVIDRETRRLVFQDRFNKIDWPLQVTRIVNGCLRYNGASLLMETNSVGDVLVRQLRERGVSVQEFVTTASTKPDLVDGLAAAFERGDIGLPGREMCAVLVEELLAYAYERTASGYVRMNAPDGQHDDCVMSLALAWRAASSARVVAEVGAVVMPGLGRVGRPHLPTSRAPSSRQSGGD